MFWTIVLLILAAVLFAAWRVQRRGNPFRIDRHANPQFDLDRETARNESHWRNNGFPGGGTGGSTG